MKWVHMVLGFVFSIARIVFGFMWIQSGYEKLTGGFGVESLIPVIAQNTDSPEWFKEFFANVVSPYSSLFDIIIPWGELLIGVGLLIGLFITPALVMSIFVNVNYILGDMIFTYPTQILFATILLVALPYTALISTGRFICKKRKSSKDMMDVRT
ncbi:hypothetical protein A374_19260 [Fictibacillus macauensis ZFHKF-1]|uniref:DoxX family protein n=1 Tax=Fictibacillus macauensis ZFHKF-1 TaxID=1196324 RepID=I8U9Q7_9BACL|nr:DoxX family protein [Fictibacillus macauensis]EIT83690.1 hypothetical protein A374_19260 [Fictibacillus macauensis ZFHKF-1]